MKEYQWSGQRIMGYPCLPPMNLLPSFSRTFTGMLMCMPAIGASAQSVVRFDAPAATWRVAHTSPHGSVQDPNFIETITRAYSYSGDTLINGTLWLRLFTLPTWEAGVTPVFCGYIRQEANFVLYRTASQPADTLYNFGLQVGDTMRFGVPGSDFVDSLRVDSIGQLLIQGVPHRVFHFSHSSMYFTLESWLSDTWIEGIGSIQGPLAPRSMNDLSDWYTFPDSTRLTCYTQSENVLWQHGGYPDCDLNILLNTEQIAHTPVRTWPNPALDELTVELPASGNATIRLLDALGRIVLHTSVNGPRPTLNVGVLRPGPYVLVVSSSTGTELRTRIMVQ